MMDLAASPGAVYTDWVLPFLGDALARGKRVALVTLVGVTGSSPRPLGSQLGVCEDGSSVGVISGDCVEPSLVLDAVKAISEQTCRIERYGHGSRFIDSRLPCGSAIDVYTDIGLTRDLVNDLLTARAQRVPVALTIDMRHHDRWVTREGSCPLSNTHRTSIVTRGSPEEERVIGRDRHPRAVCALLAGSSEELQL